MIHRSEIVCVVTDNDRVLITSSRDSRCRLPRGPVSNRQDLAQAATEQVMASFGIKGDAIAYLGCFASTRERGGLIALSDDEGSGGGGPWLTDAHGMYVEVRDYGPDWAKRAGVDARLVSWAEADARLWSEQDRTFLHRARMLGGLHKWRGTCLTCRGSSLSPVLLLETDGIAPHRPGHELAYAERALLICAACFAGEMQMYDHDCFSMDADEPWDMYYRARLSFSDMMRLLARVASCPTPLTVTCQCQMHRALREARNELDAVVRAQGRQLAGGSAYSRAADVRLVVGGGLSLHFV